jgi:hypothetical protein
VKKINVARRDQKLQTPVSNCKKKPSAGDYLLLSDEE